MMKAYIKSILHIAKSTKTYLPTAM